MNYINSQNPEISLTGIILLIAKYENIFGRNYMTKFFYFKELGEYPRNEDMLWDLHTYNNKFIYISENQNEILTKINTKIYNNLNYIISKYKSDVNVIETNIINSRDTGKNENIIFFYLRNIFYLLCNIYDLNSEFYKLYFKKEWIYTYIKMFELFIDFNNLPSVLLAVPVIKEDLHIFLYV